MPVQQILVASYLPSQVAPSGLRQSMRAARERAASCGLSGGLLFDGERFVQLFAGPDDATRQALALLHADAAHERVKGLHACTREPDPTWLDWRVDLT